MIPIYSHSDSTLYFDDLGKLYAPACSVRSISTDPVMYILAQKDPNATDYGYFKNAENDVVVDIVCYQNNTVWHESTVVAALFGSVKIVVDSVFEEFYLYAEINGDEGVLHYNVGFQTTLADVEKDLADFTYYHDGTLGTGSNLLAELIMTYLQKYYTTESDMLRAFHYFLPLAYKSAPDVWVTNLCLDFDVSFIFEEQNVFLRDQNAIIPDYEAVFLTMKCNVCEKDQYVVEEVTNETTFKSLRSFVTIVTGLVNQAQSFPGTFEAADWSELYYGKNGCNENSLIDDPTMPKTDRYYNLLDTMSYGEHIRKDVSLIKLGTLTYENVLEEGADPVVMTRDVYLLLDIAEN